MKLLRFLLVMGITLITLGIFNITSISPSHWGTGNSKNPFSFNTPSIIPTISKPNSSTLWGETGSIVFPLAANIMNQRNKAGVELDATQKKYFRPHFSDLVDRVKISY